MDYRTLFEKTSPTRLFFTVAIPGVIGMLVSTVYRIADAAFVGQVLGSTAFAALNLAIPFVIMNFSIADLVGVGSSVQIAIKLGEKDEAAASNLFISACILIVFLGVALGAAFYVFAEDLVRLMGANEELVRLSVQVPEGICGLLTGNDDHLCGRQLPPYLRKGALQPDGQSADVLSQHRA